MAVSGLHPAFPSKTTQRLHVDVTRQARVIQHNAVLLLLA